MAADSGVLLTEMIGNESVVGKIPVQQYVTETIGLHTLQDILKELKKPGLDPRSEAQAFEFAGIYSIEDVYAGMIVPGIVTNLTRFGAFVDIGVKQDGLVHVSEIAHKYISDPGEALKLNDQVMVKVTEVDIPRKRIALSIKQTQDPPNTQGPRPKRDQGGSKPKPKEQESANINDALSQLRKKFGK